MPIYRYFYSNDLLAGEQICLEEAESHHLAVAVRGRIGESVEVINGKGFLAKAVVKKVDKRKGVFLTLTEVQKKAPPKHSLLLLQALPRSNRLETIIEKVIELGVTEIHIFPGERSEKIAVSKRVKNIAIAAMKQCGALYLPEIHMIPPIQQWSEFSCPAFFGDPTQEEIFFPVGLATKQSVAIIIGPESGFSEKESEKLEKLGCIGVSFSKNVLRTDTAAIAAVALLTVPLPSSL